MPLQANIYAITGFLGTSLIITDVVPRLVSPIFSDIENDYMILIGYPMFCILVKEESNTASILRAWCLVLDKVPSGYSLYGRIHVQEMRRFLLPT
jgi:hypothetical protein